MLRSLILLAALSVTMLGADAVLQGLRDAFIPGMYLSTHLVIKANWPYEPIFSRTSLNAHGLCHNLVYKDRNRTVESAPSWRVQSCSIEFGSERAPLAVSSEGVYASPNAAHEDMRRRALQKIRLSGYTGPEEDIVWRLHMIG